MNKVCVSPFVQDGTMKVHVTRVNREAGVFEALDKDGAWRIVNPYISDPNGAFCVPKAMTQVFVANAEERRQILCRLGINDAAEGFSLDDDPTGTLFETLPEAVTHVIKSLERTIEDKDAEIAALRGS